MLGRISSYAYQTIKNAYFLRMQKREDFPFDMIKLFSEILSFFCHIYVKILIAIHQILHDFLISKYEHVCASMNPFKKSFLQSKTVALGKRKTFSSFMILKLNFS